MMTDRHKELVIAALVGVALGWFVTVFLVYPPKAGWSQDLKIGDVATWVGAGATFMAALTALYIANGQASRERSRFERRAEVHAAYIFNEIALVYRHIDAIYLPASTMKFCLSTDSFKNNIASLAEQAETWRSLIERIPAETLAELPDECAPHTAGAISSARYVVMMAKNLRRSWDFGIYDEENARAIGKAIEKRCEEIADNLRAFSEYAKRTFGTELDVWTFSAKQDQL